MIISFQTLQIGCQLYLRCQLVIIWAIIHGCVCLIEVNIMFNRDVYSPCTSGHMLQSLTYFMLLFVTNVSIFYTHCFLLIRISPLFYSWLSSSQLIDLFEFFTFWYLINGIGRNNSCICGLLRYFLLDLVFQVEKMTFIAYLKGDMRK